MYGFKAYLHMLHFLSAINQLSIIKEEYDLDFKSYKIHNTFLFQNNKYSS